MIKIEKEVTITISGDDVALLSTLCTMATNYIGGATPRPMTEQPRLFMGDPVKPVEEFIEAIQDSIHYD